MNNLLIISNSPRFFEYACNKNGYNYKHIMDKPNERAFGKIMGRLHVRFYEKVLSSYYKKEIEKLDSEFDCILIVRGEYTTIEAIELLKSKYPNAKLVLYMWDSIANNKGIEKKWYLFDKVVTFDRADYLKYKEQISFLPLFYNSQAIEALHTENDGSGIKYDIAFIGTAHGDRPVIINRIKKECEERGLAFYSFLYSPHITVYWYNKIFNPNYKHIHKSDLSFKPLRIEQIYNIYNQSKCIVDIEIKTQTGLTMRTIDVLGLKKKMITTNSDIKNYDFYNSDNIMIVDRDNFVIDKDFIDSPYCSLSQELYERYSVVSWLNNVLE